MQKRHRLKQNAVLRGESFEADNSYHYDGCGKRLSDLCNYGYAERKWDDEKGYLRYQVSEKWLCIKNFKDFKENTLKMKQYRASAKKTREESAVKKECKMIWTTGISSHERWKNGGNMWIESNADVSYSPRSPPVWYVAWTNMDETVSIRTNADLSQYKDISIWQMHFSTREEIEEERRNPTLQWWMWPNAWKYIPKQPRYKRLRSALTGK